MAEMSANASVTVEESETDAVDDEEPTSPYAGVERRVVGVPAVPKWQPWAGAEVLPRIYQDILEAVADTPGPVRTKQIVPRIGLPTQVGKIETTRSKLKRLVARGWRDEDEPELFTPARHRAAA
ncbi:hypothetical protein A6A06_38545 [Streptomyces sp. CB02923]|nr:hypothetical protein A6A06_38545 [Streptomyces sp. CB02923]